MCNEGIPEDPKRFILNAEILWDDKTVLDCMFQRNSVVDLVLLLLGGPWARFVYPGVMCTYLYPGSYKPERYYLK